MKVGIPNIALSLAFAVPASYATVHLVRTTTRKRCHRHRVVLCRLARPLQRSRDQLQNASGADEPDLL